MERQDVKVRWEETPNHEDLVAADRMLDSELVLQQRYQKHRVSSLPDPSSWINLDENSRARRGRVAITT